MLEIKPQVTVRKEGITDEMVQEKVDKFAEVRARQEETFRKLKNKELVSRTVYLSAELDDIIVAFAKSRHRSIHSSLLEFVLWGLADSERHRAERGMKSLVDFGRQFGKQKSLERQAQLKKEFDKEVTNITNTIFGVGKK